MRTIYKVTVWGFDNDLQYQKYFACKRRALKEFKKQTEVFIETPSTEGVDNRGNHLKIYDDTSPNWITLEPITAW